MNKDSDRLSPLFVCTCLNCHAKTEDNDNVPLTSGDVFGVNDMLDALRAFCEEQGAEMPFANNVFRGFLRKYLVVSRIITIFAQNKFIVIQVFGVW